ncbi:MAG: D-alanyl-D-alanine carboxypeptidase family protein [Chitinophagales bacterium]
MSGKRWLSFFIVLVFLCSICSYARAENPSLDVKADSAILMDADSGKVLYEKNPDSKLPPASMTKLMTLVLGIEALEQGKVKKTEKVVASENAWKLGGSQIYLEPGEEMTYQDMLISIAVGSANDACVAVAEHLDGSHEVFVDHMNREAKKVGMKNTHFVNAYGLPAEGHYSCARDMALLGRYALNFPDILEYTGIKEYSLRNGEFKLYNTNKLLWWYKGADGFKTGWTNEAKYCLVSTVKRNDLRLVATVMASPEPRGNFRDSMALFNYGFARYSYRSFSKRGSICGAIKVGKGTVEMVKVVAADNIGTICPKGEESKVTCRKQIDSYINAPFKKGTVVGKAVVCCDGKQVKTVNLVTEKGVEKSSLWDALKKMWSKIFIF